MTRFGMPIHVRRPVGGTSMQTSIAARTSPWHTKALNLFQGLVAFWAVNKYRKVSGSWVAGLPNHVPAP